MAARRPLPYVLMLENDQDDRYITRSTLAELGVAIEIRFVSSGQELLKFLAIARKPSLILLAHNAHPVSGVGVLKEIKSYPQYGHIPIVILSESLSADYINNYYRLGASSVITKPSTVELTTHKMKTFFNYWLQVAEI